MKNIPRDYYTKQFPRSFRAPKFIHLFRLLRCITVETNHNQRPPFLLSSFTPHDIEISIFLVGSLKYCSLSLINLSICHGFPCFQNNHNFCINLQRTSFHLALVLTLFYPHRLPSLNNFIRLRQFHFLLFEILFGFQSDFIPRYSLTFSKLQSLNAANYFLLQSHTAPQ